ncbi:MAG: hypothetical protein ABH858_00375 [Candidatus Omnitrophota bacterium]
MFKKRVFFVVSADSINRRRTVENITIKILNKKDSSLNTHVFYGKDAHLDKVKELVLSFSFGRDKVIIFKQADTLPEDLKAFLRDNIKDMVSNNYFIFEIERDYFEFQGDKRLAKDKLFELLSKEAHVFRISSFSEQASIKKLLLMIRRKRLPEALSVLEDIFDQETKKEDFLGVQILGALTRQFSYMDNSLEKERCFNLIWQSERIIKEGRVEQKVALQLLITKLLFN